MDANINLSEELYQRVSREFLADVMQQVEEMWKRELKKTETARALMGVVSELLDDMISDAVSNSQPMIQYMPRRSKVLTNGSLKQNKSDHLISYPTLCGPNPARTTNVKIGTSSVTNPMFSKSALFNTYALTATKSTPCTQWTPPSVHVTTINVLPVTTEDAPHVSVDIAMPKNDMEVTEIKTEMPIEDISAKLDDNKWVGVGYTAPKKGFGEKVRRFARALFSCCLPQDTV